MANSHRGLCAYCMKDVGRENLKLCQGCRTVRYCSKVCQRAAWKHGHKKSCQIVTPDASASHEWRAMSKFIDAWKGVLTSWSCWALDLSNHPKDRLQSHIFFLEFEARSKPPSRPLQSYRMVGGHVLSRQDFRQRMVDLDMGDEQIAEWESDVRGVDTVQVAMYCHGPHPLMRWLYFSLRDGGEDLRSTPPEFSRVISENWQEKLTDIMETGQIERSSTHVKDALMEAVASGRLVPPE